LFSAVIFRHLFQIINASRYNDMKTRIELIAAENHLGEAMQDVWNDRCQDIGETPTCFEVRGPKTTRIIADFEGSAFVRDIIETLEARGCSLHVPPPKGKVGELFDDIAKGLGLPETPEEKIAALEEQIRHMIQHRERLKNDIGRLESRLQKISDTMENIVVTEGEDAGVVLLSTEAPCRYEAGSNVAIYGLPYFSPLGESLMEVYHLASQREAAGTADEKPDGQAENAEPIHGEKNA